MKEELNVLKKYVLNSKLQEYFKKNPKAKSAIFHVTLGESKIAWHVKRTKKGFSITEVSAKKEKFLIEATLGQTPAQQPAQKMTQTPEQAKALQAFNQVMGQSDPNTPEGKKAIHYAFNQHSAKMHPQTKTALNDYLDSMGISTSELNKADSGQFSSLTSTAPKSSFSITSGRQRKGRIVKEAEGDVPQEKEEPEPAAEPQGQNQATDLSPQQPPEEEGPSKTIDQKSFADRLQGKTIETADVKMTTDGGLVTIKTVDSGNPVEIEWDNMGKIVARMNNVPYFIRKRREEKKK